jgi:hypothetical protein
MITVSAVAKFGPRSQAARARRQQEDEVRRRGVVEREHASLTLLRVPVKTQELAETPHCCVIVIFQPSRKLNAHENIQRK